MLKYKLDYKICIISEDHFNCKKIKIKPEQ